MEKIVRRRDAFPWWIKYGSFVFVILGVVGIVILISLFFGHLPDNSNFYGFQSYYYPEYVNTVIIAFSFILNSITSLIYWLEKDYFIKFAKYVVYYGFSMLMLSSVFYFNEIFGDVENFLQQLVQFLVLFYLLSKLKKKESIWDRPPAN